MIKEDVAIAAMLTPVAPLCLPTPELKAKAAGLAWVWLVDVDVVFLVGRFSGCRKKHSLSPPGWHLLHLP